MDGDGSRQKGREVSHSTLKAGFFAVFAGGPHCLWCPKRRWSPPLCTSIGLQIDKNGLEVRKLWPPKVGAIVFTENSKWKAHRLFLNPSNKSLNITLLP